MREAPCKLSRGGLWGGLFILTSTTNFIKTIIINILIEATYLYHHQVLSSLNNKRKKKSYIMYISITILTRAMIRCYGVGRYIGRYSREGVRVGHGGADSVHSGGVCCGAIRDEGGSGEGSGGEGVRGESGGGRGVRYEGVGREGAEGGGVGHEGAEGDGVGRDGNGVGGVFFVVAGFVLLASVAAVVVFVAFVLVVA